MGRGLSDLQKWIAHEADVKGTLYYPDILVRYFGWEALYEPMLDARGHPVAGKLFSPDDIGLKVYRSTMATLSRSCRRLHERQLIRHYHRGPWRWSFVTSMTVPIMQSLSSIG